VSYSEIILIAIGLSMDAFAVSICLGLSVKKPKIKEFLLAGIYFGLFQAIMPIIGYFAGTLFAEKIQSFDHWIAFALLGVIGAKMIKEGFAKEECCSKNNFLFANMLVLAVATSIDAMAVGITFAFFTINIFTAVAIIGLTTFVISMIGVKVGNIFGTKFRSKAEIFGGAVLIALGLKILLEGLL
jgi:putative Mn2+ efflux pump MntP